MHKKQLVIMVQQAAASLGRISPAQMGENHAQVAVFGGLVDVKHVCMVQGSVLPKSLTDRYGEPNTYVVPRAFAVAKFLH